MDLPGMIGDVVQPLLDAMPLDQAMSELLPKRPADQLVLKIAWGIVADPVIAPRPDLIAGIWLYVDYR